MASSSRLQNIRLPSHRGRSKDECCIAIRSMSAIDISEIAAATPWAIPKTNPTPCGVERTNPRASIKISRDRQIAESAAKSALDVVRGASRISHRLTLVHHSACRKLRSSSSTGQRPARSDARASTRAHRSRDEKTQENWSRATFESATLASSSKQRSFSRRATSNIEAPVQGWTIAVRRLALSALGTARLRSMKVYLNYFLGHFAPATSISDAFAPK